MFRGSQKKNPKFKLGRFASWGLSGTGRVAGPHHFNADPDPSVHFNADPDPSFHFKANLDPSHHQSDTNRDHLPTDPLSKAPFCASPPPWLHFEPLKFLNFDFNADQDLHGSRSSLFWQSGPGFPLFFLVYECTAAQYWSQRRPILFSSLILCWDNKDGLYYSPLWSSSGSELN